MPGKWGELRGEYLETRELAEALRLLMDGAGHSLRSLEGTIPHSKTAIADRLTGEKRPDWRFVEELVTACTGHDRRARQTWIARLRPLWEAADPSRVHPVRPANDGPELLNQTVERIAAEVARLTAARDGLEEEVRERRAESAELERKVGKLAETRRRLGEAEAEKERAERRRDQAAGRRPADTPATSPDTVQDSTPDTARDAVQDSVQDTAQDTAQDSAPDTASDTVQGSAPDSPPDARTLGRTPPEMPPETPHETPHETAAGTAAGTAGGRAGMAAPARAAAGRVPLVWERVPPRNRFFTGRDDLLSRLDAGFGGVPPAPAQVLIGPFGVGKTQIAKEYAHRFGTGHDLVWWISADEPRLVRSSLARLAPHLGLPRAGAAGIDDAAQAVLDALRAGTPYARWLLIYDDADRPGELDFLIPEGPGQVLITSRDPAWRQVVTGFEVDVFTREESVRFLYARWPGGLDDAGAHALAEAAAGLPLALEQAAALCGATGMAVRDWVEMLDRRTSEMLSEGRPGEYPMTLTIALGLSAVRLGAHPAALELLRYCAFIPPGPIPREIFERRLNGAGGDGTLLRDRRLLDSAIAEVCRGGLARMDKSRRVLHVHPLVQALLRDEIPAAEGRRIENALRALRDDPPPGPAGHKT